MVALISDFHVPVSFWVFLILVSSVKSELFDNSFVSTVHQLLIPFQIFTFED